MNWTINAMNPDDGTTDQRTYAADTIGEALLMAERADAGRLNRIYGVRPEDYDRARHEGIAFNEADGLLL